MAISKATAKKREENYRKERAQEFVRNVLETVFGQRPTKKKVNAVADKVLRALPKHA